MGRIPCRGNLPFLLWESEMFLLCVGFCLPDRGCLSACPAGSTARALGAGCLLAAMPLRDSSYPVGAVPPYGWGVALAGKRFSANHRTFAGADILSARQRNFTNLLFPSAKRGPFPVLLVAACPAGDCFFACPAGAKTTFSFALQKKKRFWTPKKKRVDQWKSWGGAVQQDRLPMLRCCSSGERLWAILLSSAAWV